MSDIPTTKNRAFISAFWAGYRAAEEGKSLEDNPYEDVRTFKGSITWSRTFFRFWRRGFREQKREQES